MWEQDPGAHPLAPPHSSPRFGVLLWTGLRRGCPVLMLTGASPCSGSMLDPLLQIPALHLELVTRAAPVSRSPCGQTAAAGRCGGESSFHHSPPGQQFLSCWGWGWHGGPHIQSETSGFAA